MNKFYAKLIILTLIVALTLTACAGSEKNLPPDKLPAQTESDNGEMTVGQLADYFLRAADDYNTETDRNAVLEGLDETAQANRLQMYVIASRAFGDIPSPTGNGRNTTPPPVDLAAAPEWSQSALRNLSNGGVLAASDLDLPELETLSEATVHNVVFSSDNGETAVPENSTPDDMDPNPATSANAGDSYTSSKEGENEKMKAPVTLKDAKILAQRFFQAFGTNLKDNFYAAVNKNELNSLEPPADGSTVGGSSEVTAKTDKQLHDLILEIANSNEDYLKGSPEQKIRDLYNSVLAIKTRNEAGVTPLRKYLDAADAAQSFSQLYEAVAMAVNELGNPGNGLFPMVPVTDTMDSSRKVMQLMTMTPMFSAGDYDDPNNEMIKEYRKDMISQLVAAGENREEAERLADGLLRMEKALSGQASDAEELGSLQSQSNRYTPTSLDEMLPQARPSEFFAAIGLKPDANMQVFDDKQFAAYARWFTPDNLELFKAMQKTALITGYSRYLSQELAENFGYESRSPEETANAAVQSLLSDELGQLYVARYFPSESKADIEKMVQLMINAFKTRIGRLDWMEETTRIEAIKKLDNLTVLIGYPDQWDFNNAGITGVSEGGSYFSNAAASETDKWEKAVHNLDLPVNPRRFPMAAFTVNAAASRNTNTLIFPAGILQPPFYDKNASFEANLGAIGSTIAHEITHMFDDGGAQYDASGTVRNWWTDNDYAHFQDLCKKAEDFYDGYEAAPGIPTDGRETLSENISDIGGIACGLEILSTMENPDYDTFFRSFARQWLRTGSYNTLAELARFDQHAPNILRTNRVLSNFQEFFDTYNIKPGDGMYVAPENRIVIW